MENNTNSRWQRLVKKLTNPKYIMVYATVGILLLIYLFGSIAYGNLASDPKSNKGFNTVRTITTLFVDNAYLGISAVGMTFVLITGGIDLSVAAVASLTGMFIAYGTTELGINPWICIAFSLFVGVGLGLLMGWVIHYLNVPPFITTLTGMFLARGVCSLISAKSITISNDVIDALAGWKVYLYHLKDGEWVKIKPTAYINFNIILFLVVLLVGIYLLQRTKFGRNVYAIGGNEQSAKLMGLPVGKTKVLVYGFNGLCSVLAGIAFTLYVKSGWNLSLQGGELDVITCAVIGGTLLTGGVGYILGTFFGVVLKALIPSLITFQGTLNSWWGKIATGLLLLLFIFIQKVVVSSSDANRKKNSQTAEKRIT
ncbi:MAG: sugar ABC transporter permease YjfF [Clostridia bacterium]|nr:sugar ABC transporter permease YjfF [Clostridia bacterium]MBR6186431.1 sugar ABC transporter permease YjfF [Clostridia bacterium]